MDKIKTTWLRRLGSIFSQSLNVIFLNGHPDESLSARSWRTKTSWAIKLIDSVFGSGHCERAFATDINHAKTLLHLVD